MRVPVLMLVRARVLVPMPNENLPKVEDIISDPNAEKKTETKEEPKPTEEKLPEVKETLKTDGPSSEPVTAPENSNEAPKDTNESQPSSEPVKEVQVHFYFRPGVLGRLKEFA